MDLCQLLPDAEGAEANAAAVVLDPSGYIYATGFTTNSDDDKDFYTVKLNSSGDTVWTARYDGRIEADDAATAIATRSDAIYVTGKSISVGCGFDFVTVRTTPPATRVGSGGMTGRPMATTNPWQSQLTGPGTS